jgi:predicted N-formylglutamate amidohydrolase
MGLAPANVYDVQVPPSASPPDSTLLGPNERPPFQVLAATSDSPFLLICDHASCAVPAVLNSLGLEAAQLQRHIGWDIGAAALAQLLAGRLGAFLILQNYSRLVIDCNRPLDSPDSIATMSDGVPIPGNLNLSRATAEQRATAIFTPYHDRIRLEMAERRRRQQPTVLVSVHSFTPVFKGFVRPWHAGTLYNRDPRLARALRQALASDGEFVIGDNEPYAASDTTDYAIPEHGEKPRVLHVGVEIRQDLIADAAGQQQWAERLDGALGHALEAVMRA